MIYTSCYDLPLARFIRCLCDQDYKALVIEGEPSQVELKEAWDRLYQEYIELSGTAQENYALTLNLEINSLFFRYVAIVESVTMLRKYRYDELVKLLKQAGHNFPFNHNDLEAYHKDLDRVLNRSKSLVVEMEKKQKELEQLQESQKGGNVTRQYFDKQLVVLSKFSGYHINEEQTTVSRYVSILQLYINHVNELNAQHERQRR